MNITQRDLSILDLLLTFGFLVTGQVRALIFPNDKDGSVTRDRLRKLEAAGFIQRRRAEVANPLNNSTIPVWIITENGICQLALHTDKPLLLNQHPPCTRTWQNFAHFVAVSAWMLKLRQAIAQQNRVRLNAMYFEHTVVNPEADDPARRYKLYTVTSAPTDPKRIVCAPDSAFELQVDRFRKAYYVELERGTDSPARIAAKKSPGYHGISATTKWKLHFPEADDFQVLCLAPTRSWRELLRKAMRDKNGADKWFFIALDELNEESFLHGDVVYTCTGGPRPLVRPAAAPLPG